MFAVVFGCERFHTYVYGTRFTVESDHKPLQMIILKNLAAAPHRLQRIATGNANGKICEIRARLDQRQATAKERHDARGVTDQAELSSGQHFRTRHPVATDVNHVALSKNAYSQALTK